MASLLKAANDPRALQVSYHRGLSQTITTPRGTRNDHKIKNLTRERKRAIIKRGEIHMTAGVRVESYAGYKAHERPVAFSLGKKTLRVKGIMDQWYGPDHTYFKVLAEDANIYILRYGVGDDRWELVFFKEGDYGSELSPGMLNDASS
jgi:hypothetical protein